MCKKSFISNNAYIIDEDFGPKKFNGRKRNISNWPSTIDFEKSNDNKNCGLIF